MYKNKNHLFWPFNPWEFIKSSVLSESILGFCISPFFHQQSEYNDTELKRTEIAVTLTAVTASCMIAAKWLKVPSSVRIIMTLKCTATFTDRWTHTELEMSFIGTECEDGNADAASVFVLIYICLLI